VAELFAWAEVVVVPSRWAEAFGLVAAEAMAAGAAVVVSDAGALPEVVGDAGRVFPAGDAAALAGSSSRSPPTPPSGGDSAGPRATASGRNFGWLTPSKASTTSWSA